MAGKSPTPRSVREVLRLLTGEVRKVAAKLGEFLGRETRRSGKDPSHVENLGRPAERQGVVAAPDAPPAPTPPAEPSIALTADSGDVERELIAEIESAPDEAALEAIRVKALGK